MKPFFSIAITTFDRFDLLKETISSVLWQSFEDFEILVGNDNINRIIDEETLGIEDKRIQYINHPKNLGFFDNLNCLFETSSGKYFTSLGDDDMYTPEFLQTVYTALVKSNFMSCVFTSYIQGEIYPDRLENVRGETKIYSGKEFLQRYLLREIKLQGSCGVFDRNYYRHIGGMRPLGNGFSPYSDNLLAITAGLLGKVLYIPDPLFFYRMHEGSISLVSGDIDAYSSAQKELLPKSIHVFKSNGLRDDFNSNLYSILQWCMKDYFTVMRRSGKLQWKKLIGYLVFFFRYIARLRDYRYRMIVITIHNTFNLIRYFINRDIRDKILERMVSCKQKLFKSNVSHDSYRKL